MTSRCGKGMAKQRLHQSDVTNHLSLPAANLKTGFWPESDRMLNLAFPKRPDV
jgi:hypothetical protein